MSNRQTFRLAIALSALVAGVVPLASASPVHVPIFPVQAEFSARLQPGKLPADRYVPIGLHLEGSFAGVGHARLPVLRKGSATLGRDVRLELEGHPSCGIKEAGRPGPLTEPCRRARIGFGRIVYESPERALQKGAVLLLSGGGSSARTRLLLRITLGEDRAVALAIARQSDDSGLSVTWTMPAVASEASVKSFAIQIPRAGRTGNGPALGLAAECPSGELSADVTTQFEDETVGELELHTSSVLPCR